MLKTTYFDVEYANAFNKSICQIGLMCEDFITKNPIYPEIDQLINPKDKFDPLCSRLHGITANTVKNSPTLEQVWDKLLPFFANTIIVGHNVAGADLDALKKNLDRYNIQMPEIYYIDTYEIAKDVIPRFAVVNYKLLSLCNFFEIDIDSPHDAFQDACLASDLFLALVKNYNLAPEEYVHRFIPQSKENFESYITNIELHRSINEFFGIIRGITIDGIISLEEVEELQIWKNRFSQYKRYKEIKAIMDSIDDILSDGKVSLDEMHKLQKVVASYLDIVSTSPVTLGTQILGGIMKGITVDGEITTQEALSLNQWLYDNIHLSGHYPFDRLMMILETALEDCHISKEESIEINSVISKLLNPVKELSKKVFDLSGKVVCLSGVFTLGSKEEVASILEEKGAIISSTLTRQVNILMIGNDECVSYSNGTYGTKVRKAIEYNQKGYDIQIIKETDFFDN